MERRLTIEEICKKLKPVLGKKVDELYLKYSIADTPELKLEIAQMLSLMYEKHLKTSLLDDKILLVPPNKETVKGEYPLGTVVYADKEFYPFGLREKEWVRHACITGMSGSGKTNFAFQVLGNLIIKKKPFIIFDWKKSFRPLMGVDKNMLCFTIGNDQISNMFKININVPPKGVPAKEWVNILCDLITESFFASFGVHKILRDTLDKAFKDFGVYNGSENYPTWMQIRDRLDKIAEGDKRGREAEWITSALRIAYALTFGAFGETINYKGPDQMSVEELFKSRTLFELNSLSSSEKKFFCEFLLTYIYKLKKTSDEETNKGFKSAILVDEAHNIFLKDRPTFIKESITDMVYRELREYGISLICLDQHISKLSDTVSGNSALTMAFQQILPADIETISGIMQLSEHKNYFSALKVGHAIVKITERHPEPFMISVPFIELKGKQIKDTDVRNKMSLWSEDRRQKFAKEIKAYQKKRVKGEIDKIKGIMQHTGVDATDEDIEKMTKAQKDMQHAVDRDTKKKASLFNHIQQEIVNKIVQQLECGYKLDIIKKGLQTFGYKNTDINKAVVYVKANRNRLSGKEIIKVSTNAIREYLEMDENALKFLRLVQQAQQPISDLYRQMDLSTRKCDTLKKQLIKLDVIKIEEVRSRRGWKKIVDLTEKGHKILMDLE